MSQTVNLRDSAFLFDLDGVLTPTAEVHMRAWGEMFNAFLARDDLGFGGSPDVDTRPWNDADYHAHVDGKPRFDGVRDFLASRGITLPEGAPDDGPDAVTVRGLGASKNAAFNAVLARDGVTAYPGSVLLLDHLRDTATPVAVVSSSRNAPAVLAAAGLADRFDVVVTGATAEQLGLPGKPAPDMFLHAASLLGVAPADCVVVEDAVSGVRAGAAGGFRAVIGVDRGVGPGVLRAAGADVVVTDLSHLLSASAVEKEI